MNSKKTLDIKYFNHYTLSVLRKVLTKRFFLTILI